MIGLFKHYYHLLILSKPGLSLLIIALGIIVLSLNLPNLKLDASADALTLEHDKDLDYFREVYQRYQTGDFLVVTFTPKDDLFADKTLATIGQLRDELLQVEGVSGANSLLDVPLLYSPPVTLSEVAKGQRTLLSEGIDKELARKEFLESPIYRDMLLGPDGRTTAILLNLAVDNHYLDLVRTRDSLRLKKSEGSLTADEQVLLEKFSAEFQAYSENAAARNHKRVAQVRAIVGDYKDRADIFVGGVSMITADMVDFIRSDLVVFGSAITAFIIFLLIIIFRHWQFILLPLSICVLSVVIMLGLVSALDWHLTVISSNFVALLLIISLQITIHLIVRYRELLSADPEGSDLNHVKQMLISMIKPCFYTVLTTSVAFASLVVSGIRPVIDFGWMMTLGLSVTFILAFTVLPAGLLLMPKPKLKAAAAVKQPFSVRFASLTEHYGRLILVLSILLIIASAAGISKLKVENRFIDYFRSDTEIHQGMLVIDQQLGGTVTLDIIIDSANTNPASGSNEPMDPLAEADPFDEPDPFEAPVPSTESDPFSSADPFSEHHNASSIKDSYWFTQIGMSQIEQLHDYLELLPEVGKVQSLAVLYKVAGDLNGGTLNNFELAVLRSKLPESIKSFLVAPYFNSEQDQARISMRIRETDPNLERGALIKKIHNYAVSELGFSKDQVHVTGLLVLYNNMLQSLYKSQILTIGAVFLGIMIMFLILFRSYYIALIAMIPNILAASIVLGIMGLVGIPLDMMTITIAAIAVGIGVDDAIHYIYRFRHEFQQCGSYRDAMYRAHGSIGSAMYYTSITIIAGFSILMLSAFIPSVYFGLLTGIAMMAAILGALTLLPKLMLLIKPLGKEFKPDEY